MGQWLCSGKGTQVSTRVCFSQRQGVRRSSLSPGCLSPGLTSALCCECLWLLVNSWVGEGRISCFCRIFRALHEEDLPWGQPCSHSTAAAAAVHGPAIPRLSSGCQHRRALHDVGSSLAAWERGGFSTAATTAGCSGDSMAASAFCSQELRMSLCCLPQLLRMENRR